MSAEGTQPAAATPEAPGTVSEEEARASRLRESLELATAQGFAQARALDVACINAHQAAEQLRAANQPSLAAQLANGAAWGAGVFLLTWGLSALANALGQRSAVQPVRERGTTEAQTDTAQPAPGSP